MKKHDKLAYTFWGLAGALIVVLVSLTKTNAQVQDIQAAVDSFNHSYFLQKAYLHTDRTVYAPGGVIWMKGYLLNGHNHKLDKRSTNLYVDMVNFRGQVVHNRVLRLRNGTARGDIAISDTLQNGAYRLRAYTGWMHNFAREYWYTRIIEINNEKAIHYQFSDKREAKKLVRRINRMDVQFFPEGGVFVSGLPNTVGIKAVNYQGEGVGFKGKIINRDDEEVASITSAHAGMGKVRFTPKPDEKYKAVLTFANGVEDKFKLPKPVEHGTVMHVQQNAGEQGFVINLHTNEKFYGNPNARKFTITGMVRNKMFHISQDTIKDDRLKLQIPKQKFPAGIVHFTLFDYMGKPVAERLAYNHRMPEIKAGAVRVKKYQDSAEVTMQLDGYKKDEEASLSMAVINQNEYGKNTNTGIGTYFLLTSDLKGKVENPEWYFTNYGAEQAAALDNLMLTQGWRRFAWEDVLNMDFEEPAYSVQNKLEVAGKVTREIIKAPFENARVELVLLNEYNDSYVTRTGEDGIFHFENLDYTDTLDMLIKARKPNGSKFVLVHMEETDLKSPGYRILKPDSFLADYKDRKKRSFDARNNKEQSPGSLHSSPDQVIDVKPYHNSGYSNVFDLLRGRVPGMNNGIIRGRNSFYLSSEPLYLLDDVPTDQSAISSIPINDIDHVEILKNPSNTAIYGVRGANGVIAVYTMQGHHVAHGKREFSMLGFHQPREFYRPAFRKAKKPDYPLKLKTLHWEPGLTPDAAGKVQARFPVRHIQGAYIISIKGVVSGKGFIDARKKLEIK